MSPDGVSIVIVSYNEENYLPRLIPNLRARLKELPDDIDTEVLLSDGGSTDRTVEIARASPLIDTIVSEQDSGVIGGRDKGIRNAEYDLQVHGDADTVYRPGWLTGLLEPFSTDYDTVLTYGSVSGEGLETGTRELYAGLLSTMGGHYCPGQNRALYRPAYKKSPYRDVPQDVALVTSLEEEVHFANRMEEHGTVTAIPSASCKTSGRQTEDILGVAQKVGGVDWKFDPSQSTATHSPN